MQTVYNIARGGCYAIILASSIFLAQHVAKRSEWYRQHLFHQLVQGDSDEQLRAATGLVQVGGQRQLLEALRNPRDDVRTVAQKALEFMWFNAAGNEAYHLTEQAYKAAEQEQHEQALKILNTLIAKYPDFAEGYNRRASVYWELGEYEKSIHDSQKAVQLNPYHYGAWQGIGVCRLKMGQVAEACRCLRAALKIVPYDDVTMKSLKRCEELLRGSLPPDRPQSKTTDII